MKLGDLKPAPGATKKRKRIGRGPGSGHGSTSTRGHKGQKARKGYSSAAWFEGGQMPLQRRLPKRGFTNIHRKPVSIVNVGELAEVAGEIITAEVLAALGLIRNVKDRIKVLGMGELGRAVTVRAHGVSAEARKKIEDAGGTVELIVVTRPKRYKKKVRTES